MVLKDDGEIKELNVTCTPDDYRLKEGFRRNA